MASFSYTKARGKLLASLLDIDGDTFKVGLSTSVHVPNIDDGFLDDAGIDDFVDGELTVGGYTGGFGGAGRKALVNRTWVDDLTNDRNKLDADDLVWNLSAGQTIEQATLMKEVTTNADSPVIFNHDFTGVATIDPFTIQWHTDGIMYAISS